MTSKEPGRAKQLLPARVTWLLACALSMRLAGADPGSDSCQGGLEGRYAGSYDTDALLNEPDIKAELQRLLRDDLEHLKANLDVRGSVDLRSGSLALAGNAVHGGGIEEAVVCISTYNGKVSAAIFSEGAITIYADDPAYEAQSLCIKDWITQVNSGHDDRFTPPQNVRFAATVGTQN